LVQAVLEAHQAQSHRAVPQVGVTRFFDRVIVDVDHVVEHAHGGGDRLLQLGVIDRAIFQVLQQIDRTQIADRGFRVAGIEGDLGA
jgi:hypothetical protein